MRAVQEKRVVTERGCTFRTAPEVTFLLTQKCEVYDPSGLEHSFSEHYNHYRYQYRNDYSDHDPKTDKRSLEGNAGVHAPKRGNDGGDRQANS